jgi:DNA adenine methylase
MILMPTEAMLTPVLKWPGGKRWFRETFFSLAPVDFNRYIEPFFGSGSIFFALQPDQSMLGDLNQELITMYGAIRDDWRGVRRLLVAHQRNHSTEYYYQVRNAKPRSVNAAAARTLYLNRTCFNGIYRVNLDGIFNVPIGTKSSVLLDTDDFEGIAAALRNTLLLCADFETLIDRAETGDLIFADPPYTVRHNFNGFVKYNENLFAWDDQKRLAQALIRAVNRGAYVISTNAYHRSVMELYRGQGFRTRNLSRYSSISASNVSRMSYDELLILSYNIP